MKNNHYIIFIFYSIFISAGLQDWIPGWNNSHNPTSTQPTEESITDIFKDRELKQECFRKQETLAKQGEYWNISNSCDLYKDMQKNIDKVKKINAYLAQTKEAANQQMAAQRKLHEIENQRFKKIAAYTALFGSSASISGLILKALLAPPSMMYSGLGTRFGFGAVAGFSIGTWRIAKIEKEKNETIESFKKQHSL